jgi:hypothetical protein
MFRFNHYHQGAYYLSFAKVTVAETNQLESSVKIHRCSQFGGVAAYTIRSAMNNVASSTVTTGF